MSSRYLPPDGRSSDRVRGSSRETEDAARTMRANPTPAEADLWSALRKRRLGGLRFRCQYPIGPFILDFCCPALRLVVEVDGPRHGDLRLHDEERTAHLEALGYQVLRFSNEEVLTNRSSVLRRIYAAAMGRAQG